MFYVVVNRGVHQPMSVIPNFAAKSEAISFIKELCHVTDAEEEELLTECIGMNLPYEDFNTNYKYYVADEYVYQPK